MFRKSIITAAAVGMFAAANVSAAQNYGQQNYNAAAQQNAGQQQPRQQMDLSTQILQGARSSRGQYFQFALGPSFEAMQESTNAVIIGSTQLGAMYGLFGWIGIQGAQTPDQFASNWVQIMQLQNVQVVASQPIAPQPGFQQAKYYEFTYTSDGRPQRGAIVVNAGSGNGAVQFAAAGADRWEQVKPALFKLASTVGASGANTFGAQDHFAATRPRGDFGIGDWKPTSSITPGIEKTWRDGSDVRRGQETVYDPHTGKTYQPKWEQYNPNTGGYVNPERPWENLSPGAAWDPR